MIKIKKRPKCDCTEFYKIAKYYAIFKPDENNKLQYSRDEQMDCEHDELDFYCYKCHEKVAELPC